MTDVAAEAAPLELESPTSSSQGSPESAANSAARAASPRSQADAAGAVVKSKKGKVQDPSVDFVNVLSNRIDEIERAAAGNGGPAEREAAKSRKKQLREVVKFCSDRANSPEDRINFIQQKYTQQLSELLRMERQLLDLQREHEVVSKEKDKVQAELKKTNLLKDKLEELCRQLQKEAREVAEESRRRNEEDLKQRQALQAKFTAAINEVSEKMDAQASERSRQLAENEELRAKLDSFLGQFESFNAMVQKKDLELQLSQARAEQATALAAQLQQRAELLQEANSKYASTIEAIKPQLAELEGLRQRNGVLTTAKDELTAQLEHYADKFAEFQDTLTKSNETFAMLREQLEAGTKARTAIAKERDEARRRAEGQDQTIVKLVQDRLALKQQVETMTAKARTDTDELRRVRTQKERLEGLCRTLQAELKALKSGGGGAAVAAAAPAAADCSEAGGSAAAAQEDTGAVGATTADASGPVASAEADGGSSSAGGGAATAAAEGNTDASNEGGTGETGVGAKKADVVSALPSDLY
ncbi:hypothetical protein HYH02_008448 [Chlamydomonas schloesseri]|uniref:Alpha-taxilin n=1 Tax=Chlamydomonas schloesseri TaxID=2026947 RepID=A0A835WFI7_9CHLO|nr:hypothetical protein HYH02_008448 [Chlamydomonas schloesseri]|eukprot:KAG2446456.1 hypothetical protein HYH02_008448 [Chlamydomonas schloesseri]